MWLDIFAINQDNTGGVFSAMDELNEGQTLADVIDLSRATKVVLDKDRVSPLRRLWCLYEIGSTPMDKLELVTHQFSERDIAQHLRSIDASTALCFSSDDKRMIQAMIVKQFGTMERFTEELKLRFLLRPMSYEADLCVLRERGAAEVLRLDAAHDHVTASAGQLACVIGTAGQGKSTLAAAMAGDPRGPQGHFSLPFHVPTHMRLEVPQGPVESLTGKSQPSLCGECLENANRIVSVSRGEEN